MERTRITRTRSAEIGIMGRLFAGLLALPVGAAGIMALRDGDLPGGLTLLGLLVVAAYAAWTGLESWTRSVPDHHTHLHRVQRHPKSRLTERDDA